jgi:hypothetical protein
MSVPRRFRDQLLGWVPWWLSDRHYSNGQTVGFRYLWAMVSDLDAYMQMTLEALMAAWPGKGTPTALPRIGRSRGIVRGQADTDEQYAAKLNLWLDKWAAAGTQAQLATELHEYFGNSPRVRVVNRAGHIVTAEQTTGVISDDFTDWDWDSVTNPERAGYWSEIWVIIYPDARAGNGTWGDGAVWGDSGTLGFGHAATRVEFDAAVAICAQWKSAHTNVRAIIWTTDGALFDPNNLASFPDGHWGKYAEAGAASGRNVTTCKYWEF